MSTIDGLPAHVLLVHFIVVVAPLVATLEIVAALWPAARSRLVWLIVVLAVLTTVLTPVTTDAGEWLEDRLGASDAIRTHADRGDWMIYFSVAMLVVALLLAALHLRENRLDTSTPLRVAVAVLAVVIGVATMVQIYRIGESGARAVWGDQVSSQPLPIRADQGILPLRV
ncbi:DUF2231 domain-containing protein [Antrihabitans cavernicola]|uniref:DUF2231 domain-containing protein n=1 Tax=Antrihabitans cavernicola TaxID=2495913 RepID=A0A5A7S8U5_9NOCA|nr:DUF2231 domain-containing protein [Spelaeibacter cavernicola]KAA0021337.1 hypothetical protein FOY51_19000 [Spelaeibacter cavernicola]